MPKNRPYTQSAAIKLLIAADLEARKLLHPTVPYMYANKFSDKNANELTKCIKRCLQLEGQQVERVGSEGRMVKDDFGNWKRIKSSGKKGTADVSATIWGRSVKIEVKCFYTGDDTQNPDQKKYQAEVERAKGVYVIARTFEGFLEWFKRFADANGERLDYF